MSNDEIENQLGQGTTAGESQTDNSGAAEGDTVAGAAAEGGVTDEAKTSYEAGSPADVAQADLRHVATRFHALGIDFLATATAVWAELNQ